MTNILPPETLHSVRRLHRARFLLVGSLAAAACGVVVLLVLVPIYIIVQGGRTAAEENVVAASLGPESEAERAGIARAQVLMRELRPFASSTPSALEILDIALSARPQGVVVSSMSYVRGEAGTIVLGGTAPSREAINTYRTVLAKEPLFKSVSVPIGILTGAEGGRFSMTLTGAF